MEKATREQIRELLINDPITLYDAIGLYCEDCQLNIPESGSSSVLRISVRSELMFKIPENISVVVDGKELLVDFDLDNDIDNYYSIA